LCMLDQYFKLRTHNTNFRTEVLAGLTTYAAMCYVIFVNPAMLHSAGMDYGAVFVATCLAAAFGCLAMGLFANYPIALAPSMGLNAFFCYTVVGTMGYSWQVALGAVFLSGVCFFLLSISKIREKIIKSIPHGLRHGIASGVGLFLGFIALKNAGIIVEHTGTIVSLGDLSNWPAAMACLGFVVTVALYFRGIKASVITGIIAVSIVSLLAGKIGFHGIMSNPPSITPVLLKLDIIRAINMGIIGIIFSFLFVDLFDNTGTLMAIAYQGNLVDKEGHPPRMGRALLVDSLACIVGALFGTSTTGSYVESGSGIAEGGRTGLTAVVVGILFLFSLFLMPLAKSIPLYATAPALFFVAILMARNLALIAWNDVTESAPAVIAAVTMPLTFSISHGIELGIVSWAAIKVLSGRWKDVSIIMYVLAALFVLKLANIL